jgi:hypothetical protein
MSKYIIYEIQKFNTYGYKLNINIKSNNYKFLTYKKFI